MAQPQLQQSEIEAIRALRVDEELTFVQIGERLGIDTSTAHRILEKPDHEFEELTLIRVRKGLARIAEEGKPKRQKAASAR